MSLVKMVLRRLPPEGGPAEDPGQRFTLRLEPGGELLFGRSIDCDILIPDQNRKVSNRHGKIQRSESGDLVAFDLGSLNGTYLGTQELDSKAPTPLPPGSRLTIGDFELELLASDDELDATVSTPSVQMVAENLRRSLEQAYAGNTQAADAERASVMQATLDASLARLSPHEGKAVLVELLGGDADPNPISPNTPPHPPSPPLPPTEPFPTTAPNRAGSTSGNDDTKAAAISALQDLADQFVPDARLEDAASVRTFGALLKNMSELLIASLAQGLGSRSVFAQEFGAEVTLVFQRSHNALKSLKHDEIKAYLLDWRLEADVEQRHRDLEGALNDLSEHQVAVLAGVKEAIQDVINRFSPERIAALAKKQTGLLQASKLMKAHAQAFEEVSGEAGKLYDDLISPSIQKGYLQKHDETP